MTFVPDAGATTHARQQADARSGVTASDAAWRQAVLDIIATVAGDDQRAILLRRYRDGAERWVVQLDGTAIIAFYDPNTATIVTVLPPGEKLRQSRVGRQDGRARHERTREEIWE